tara:strand:- start:7571 stop:7918 length:348 start_codon:yes stop_codon:yes gene_type:complete
MSGQNSKKNSKDAYNQRFGKATGMQKPARQKSVSSVTDGKKMTRSEPHSGLSASAIAKAGATISYDHYKKLSLGGGSRKKRKTMKKRKRKRKRKSKRKRKRKRKSKTNKRKKRNL